MDIKIRGRRFATALLVVGTIVGGVVCGLIVRGGHQLPVPVQIALAAATLACVFLGMRPWWRTLDHMQQDGRVLSWYWGGGLGGAIGLMAALVVGGPHSPLFAGAALVWLSQFAGYAAARLKWWIAFRPTTA